MTQCRRVSVAGVSVSPSGFWAMLGIPGGGYWPLQITTSYDDAHSATTPEALTVLQLLAGVDMAGAILPPDVLPKLVIFHAEENPHALYARQLTALLELPDGIASYSETNDWQRSKMRLPHVTLDELTLNPLRLDVSVKGLGPLSFTPSSRSIEAVCWNFDPKSSTEFISLSLALRYRAPIIVHETPTNTLTCISDHFPLYSTIEGLRRTSQRVSKNLEVGLEIHKLHGALRIARQRGDAAAERKIQAKLDELEQSIAVDDEGPSSGSACQ
ncbi:hypothetical protein MHU86_21010 [Fragilaria crotonensis]|nr:hypothetical protein MHU86_21010 [Fragilaria crotonensis]